MSVKSNKIFTKLENCSTTTMKSETMTFNNVDNNTNDKDNQLCNVCLWMSLKCCCFKHSLLIKEGNSW